MFHISENNFDIQAPKGNFYMKSILNKTRQFSLILVIIISMMQPNSAYAASITVNSLADTVGDDGICTLREAIIAANTDTASVLLANVPLVAGQIQSPSQQ